MKIFNIIFCVLFIIAAALQYNDPDPYLWIPIYLYAAVLCWLAFRRRFYPRLYITGIILYAGYAVFLLLENNGVLDWFNNHAAENIASTMKATKPWIENTREFFGLLILIAVLLVNLIYARKRNFRF
ncbi:MAG TPA: transmembrane 220 family protein [Flavitalea sp.]|nr:transmembrane 220 family protein [Flavitalea sp.]